MNFKMSLQIQYIFIVIYDKMNKQTLMFGILTTATEFDGIKTRSYMLIVSIDRFSHLTLGFIYSSLGLRSIFFG